MLSWFFGWSSKENDDKENNETRHATSADSQIYRNQKIYKEQMHYYNSEVNKYNKANHGSKRNAHGFYQETHHAISYNNDAIKKNVPFRAYTTQNNAKNGHDIYIKNINTNKIVEKIQSKSYKDFNGIKRQEAKYPEQTMLVNSEHKGKCYPINIKKGPAQSKPISNKQAKSITMKSKSMSNKQTKQVKGNFKNVKPNKMPAQRNMAKNMGQDLIIGAGFSAVCDVVNGKNADEIVSNMGKNGAESVVFGLATNVATECISTGVGEEIGAAVAPGVGSVIGGVVNAVNLKKAYNNGDLSSKEYDHEMAKNIVGTTTGAASTIGGATLVCPAAAAVSGPIAPVTFLACVAGTSFLGRKAGEKFVDSFD